MLARLARFITKRLITFLSLHEQGELAFLILEKMTTKDAARAAEPLMRLDSKLHELHGQAAIAQNRGIHPKHELTDYHQFFVERIRPGERVLDFGTGIGAVSYDIAEQTKALVDGIDIAPENIATAHLRFSHPQVQYFEGDGLKISPNPPYDIVVMSNVLEHLEQRPQALKSIQQASQAKRFLIRVPSFERDWRVPYKRRLGVEWRLDEDHKTEFTEVQFRAELAEAGFEIVHLEIRWGEIWAEALVSR